jgi:hypothetical protein
LKITHLFLRSLEQLETPKPSYVMWSFEPATTVVFFVHGFGGSALSTWRQFDSLAPTSMTFERADLVFLGYDSLWEQTDVSAGQLELSCRKLIRNPAALMNPSLSQPLLRRSTNHRYENVWFVAHSLGAIVTRRILLIAQNKKLPWLDKVRMVLFAPAHKGATDVSKIPSGLARLFAGRLSGVVGDIVGWKIQTLSEATKGSETLRDLEKRTNDALAARRGSHLPVTHLIASRVIFGTAEDIVSTTRFCEDPDLDPIKDKGHKDVCKPTPKFSEPLKLVGDAETAP